jgi:hypothetical protein
MPAKRSGASLSLLLPFPIGVLLPIGQLMAAGFQLRPMGPRLSQAFFIAAIKHEHTAIKII